MNEKDTIIGLQKEVIEGLKKELKTVYYCGDKLAEKIGKLEKHYKRNSKAYYVMGFATGIVLCNLVRDYIDKKKDEKLIDFDEYRSNNKVENNKDEDFTI